MGDPVTIGALALGAIGAGVSAAGAISAGNARSSEAQFQAQVARNNAITQDQNATYVTRAGVQDATTAGLKGRAAFGKVAAAQAANNIELGSKSAVEVRESEAAGSRLDTLTVMNNALLKAYGYRTAAVNDRSQGGLYDQEASNASKAGDLTAAAGLLGSASSIGFKYASMQAPSPGGGGGGGGLTGSVSADEWNSAVGDY